MRFQLTADQFYRFILFVLLGLFLLLLMDSYWLPLDYAKGVLVTKTEQSLSMLRVAVFRVHTEKSLITVPGIAYKNIRVNDTIHVGRSYITHKIMKVGLYGKGKSYQWQTGFVISGGLDYLIFLIVSLSAYLFYFSRKISKRETRRDLMIFLVAISGLFMGFYFLF
jgi:hypothetical protein